MFGKKKLFSNNALFNFNFSSPICNDTFSRNGIKNRININKQTMDINQYTQLRNAEILISNHIKKLNDNKRYNIFINNQINRENNNAFIEAATSLVKDDTSHNSKRRIMNRPSETRDTSAPYDYFKWKGKKDKDRKFPGDDDKKPWGSNKQKEDEEIVHRKSLLSLNKEINDLVGVVKEDEDDYTPEGFKLNKKFRKDNNEEE